MKGKEKLELLDKRIKDLGGNLVTLGHKLQSVGPGGDCRDLLGLLRKNGIGTELIDELLTERNRLAAAMSAEEI